MEGYMEGCPTCENWEKERGDIILKNDLTMATFSDSFREGHCVVRVKDT
jgi:hypothetical protein